MADTRHISMELAEWLHQLDGLGLAAAASERGQEPGLFRSFRRLLEEAPSPDLLDGLCVPRARDGDALIQAGAHESAMLAFLGAETGFCLSRGADGDYLASIILPRRSAESTARGASMALACLGAVVIGLADLAPRMATRLGLVAQKSSLLH